MQNALNSLSINCADIHNRVNLKKRLILFRCCIDIIVYLLAYFVNCLVNVYPYFTHKGHILYIKNVKRDMCAILIQECVCEFTTNFVMCIIGDSILPHLEWEPAAPALHI